MSLSNSKMKHTLIALFICSLMACKHESLEMINTLPPTIPDTLSYLALGDSYTIGQGVSPNERYPNLLADTLDQLGIPMHEPQIIAQTGWTTANLITAINNAQINTTFDFVSLLIGVNNQYQHKPITEYQQQFEQLLQKAIVFANNDTSKVVVLSIPDYGYTPFGQANQATISAQIAEFNAINKAIANAYGVQYFDITPISQQALLQPNLVATDELHPSGEMYKQWVALMINNVKELLKNGG
jgi:acyl-CoA thioesterase-1